MKITIDTHVHIYPFYDIGKSLLSLIENMDRHTSSGEKIACLTERYDCDVFSELAKNPGDLVTDQFDIECAPNLSYLRIRHKKDDRSFYLLPGQQIITSENLEILGLNLSKRIAEGASAEKTIQTIRTNGGIPVIAWGFGKWLGKRGKVVNNLINSFSSSEIALGDTSMRPYGWTTPLPFKQAKTKGIKILCGSDPLPFVGEEIRPGSYTTQIEIDEKSFDPTRCLSSILNGDVEIRSAGTRNTIFQVARRIQNHRRAGKIPHLKTEN